MGNPFSQSSTLPLPKAEEFRQPSVMTMMMRMSHLRRHAPINFNWEVLSVKPIAICSFIILKFIFALLKMELNKACEILRRRDGGKSDGNGPRY